MYTLTDHPRARETPADTAPAVALPDAVHELVEYEVECARADGYRQGYRAALRDVASRQVELSEAWGPIGHKTYEWYVARRAALFERCAALLAEKVGRREWRDVRTRRPGVRVAGSRGERAA